MFAIRNVMSTLGYGAEPQAAELAKIEAGEFYLTRNDQLRGGRQCIYPKAMLSVSKTSVPFNYQLTVSRVYEEGDANILDEDEEEDTDEQSFLIGSELAFRTYTFEGRYAFGWRDVEAADPGDRFEFVAEAHTKKAIRDFVETTILRSIYERKCMKSAAGVSDKDLRAFAYEPEPDSSDDEDETPVRAVKTRGGSSSAAALSGAMDSLSLSSSKTKATPPSPKSKAKGKGKAASVTATVGADDAEHGTLVSEIGDLYLWDFKQETFNVIEEEIAAKVVDMGGGEQFNYWLVVSDGANKLIGHKLSVDQNAKWSLPDLSVSWINPEGAPPFETWVIAFADVLKFDAFKKTYQQCLWEIKNGQPWAKAAAADQSYALQTWNGYAEIDMRDPSDDEEEESQEESEPEEEEEEEDDEGAADPEASGPGDTNSNLVVGHNKDRAFVVRGNKIGVFSTDGEKIAFKTTMKGIKTKKGKAFVPEQVMLHNQDASMILSNPDDPRTLYRVDLGERGEIVEEWKVHDDIEINNMAPNSKFAPTTHEQTFVGTSHNALFRIDPRISGSKLVDSESKQYATKAKFSSLATTQLGKVVVGSAKGDLRMFDSIGKIAKTALPALGDPVIGVDTTADGKWIVATTKTALLVFDMTISEGKYAGQLGFDRSFPANAKPLAKRLMLSSQHAAYMGGVSFTPARFNTGPDQLEKTIVTSSGQYVIAWDFNRVKNGKADRYEIKQYGDSVVSDNFIFGDSNDIVVALKNNVVMVDKKSLKKPTRASLAATTPTRRAIRS